MLHHLAEANRTTQIKTQIQRLLHILPVKNAGRWPGAGHYQLGWGWVYRS